MVPTDLDDEDLGLMAELTAKPRQNSYDFVIAAFIQQEAEAGGPQRPAAEQQQQEQGLPLKPRPTHARPYQLRDYLPGFEGDVDGDCEVIELGTHPRPGENVSAVPSQVVKKANAQKSQTVLSRLTSWLTAAR